MDNFSKSKVVSHNERLEAYAEEKAAWLRSHPTETEKLLKDFLKEHSIKFLFKKAMFYKPMNTSMEQYNIADFFIPKKNTIINVGNVSFSRDDKYSIVKYEEFCKRYPSVSVIHWSGADFRSYQNMKALLALLK